VGALSYEQARRVYDRIGALQDRQAFYEDRATSEILRHGRFSEAEHVFEFGCGTGRLALELLGHHLPPRATYRGVDLSPTMVALARPRIAPFSDRAEVRLSEGAPPSDEPAASCDRWLSTYVLDLLAEDDIAAVLSEAHRMLRPGGLLCLAGLSTGTGPCSRTVSRAWSWVQRLRPALVGGCRPVELRPFLAPSRWRLVHHATPAPFCVPSEVVVAERR
jgi:SAM-dependent methyltransferase